jgi:hypothetical protein
MKNMTTFRPDLLIEDDEGKPIAIVEVKSRQDLDRASAIEIRRNMLARGLPADVPYFLLLSQDVGYLWKETKQVNADAEPLYEFPMDKVITRYLNGNSDKRLYESVLELVILQWLTNLTTKPQPLLQEPERTLALAGFNDSIKDAVVLIEAEAQG